MKPKDTPPVTIVFATGKIQSAINIKQVNGVGDVTPKPKLIKVKGKWRSEGTKK